MKNKKAIITTVVIIVALTLGYYFMKPAPVDNSSTNNKVEDNKKEEEENTSEGIKFLRQIAGVKATEIEIIDNPVGIKGEFLAPRESILNAVDYFLKDTKNSKMENTGIDLGKGYIDLSTDYKVNSFITTPIKVKVKPSLDESKNLVLEVYELKFLDLKIANWIVNMGVESFIKDWFPKDKDFKVTFEEGRVIVDKSNFESIILNEISIDPKGMKIDMIINLEKIIVEK